MDKILNDAISIERSLLSIPTYLQHIDALDTVSIASSLFFSSTPQFRSQFADPPLNTLLLQARATLVSSMDTE